MDYEEIESRAKGKLKFIISKFGDANGERLKPYYLEQLINEGIKANKLFDYTYKNTQKKCLTCE